MPFFVDFIWNTLQNIVSGPLADALAGFLIWVSGGALDRATATFIAQALLTGIIVLISGWIGYFTYRLGRYFRHVVLRPGCPDRVVIAFADLIDDRDCSQTRHLRRLLRNALGLPPEPVGWWNRLIATLGAHFGPACPPGEHLQVIETAEHLHPVRDKSDVKGLRRCYDKGQERLAKLKADLLIFGRFEQSEDFKKPHLVYLTTLRKGSEIGEMREFFLAVFTASADAELTRHLGDALAAVVLASLPPEVYSGGRFIADILLPVVQRLEKLFHNMPTTWGWQLRGTIAKCFGDAAGFLGLQTGKEEWLDKAVAAHREALTEYTRERVPLAWATTQNNLGAALWALGLMRGDKKLLEEAIAAYGEALKEWKRELVPLDWATTQNNLGNARYDLGLMRGSVALIEQAVVAYREALKERTQDRVPLDWAATQNNLGNALVALGRMLGSEARLEEAIAAFQEALKERVRERVPLDWAGTQNNLGTALGALGVLRLSEALLKESIAAFREALKERTQERVPLDWAMTKSNLGNALSYLGGICGSEKLLEEAIAVFHEALKEYTRECVPLDWAMTQNNLGNALLFLGRMRGSEELIEQAIVAYRGALEVLERHQHAYAERVRRSLVWAEQVLADMRERKSTGAMAFIWRLIMRLSRKDPNLQMGEMLPPFGERVHAALAALDPAERLRLVRERHGRLGCSVR